VAVAVDSEVRVELMSWLIMQTHRALNIPEIRRFTAKFSSQSACAFGD
jgi:hypothetical protein